MKKKYPPGSFAIAYNQDINIEVRYVSDDHYELTVHMDIADKVIEIWCNAKKKNGVFTLDVYRFGEDIPLSQSAYVLKIFAAEETRIIGRLLPAFDDEELILNGGYF